MAGKEIWISIPRERPFKNVYQFKITLQGIVPPIWRRFQIPESYTFYDLHVAIQDVMGWEDYHLHQFIIKGERLGNKNIIIESPFIDELSEDVEPLMATDVPLDLFFKKPGDKALYVYDFGNNWQHEILLEKIEPKAPRQKYPTCLAGQRACPPEDCGGVPCYYRCLEALKNNDNSDELLDWLADWHPESFASHQVRFESSRKRFDRAFG